MTEYDVVMIPVGELRENPLNDTLYDRDREDTDPAFKRLVTDIALRGIRQPLVVYQDGTIVSGHRRYRAAQILGLEEVPCIIEDVDDADPDTEKLHMRMDNAHREESFSEKMKAVDDYKPMVQRILLARKRHEDPSELVGYEYIAPIIEELEGAVTQIGPESPSDSGALYHGGTQPSCGTELSGKGALLSNDNTCGTEPSGEGAVYQSGTQPIRWEDVVGVFVGMSHNTVIRGYSIWQAACGGDEHAMKLVDALDRGEISISAAYRKLKETEREDDDDPPSQKEIDDKVSSTIRSMMNGEDMSSVEKPSATSAPVSSPKIDKLCDQVRRAVNDGARPGSLDLGRLMMATMRQEMNDESSPGLVCLDIDGSTVGEEYADITLRLWIRPGDLRDHAMAVRDATFSKFPFWSHVAALVTLVKGQYNEADPFRDID